MDEAEYWRTKWERRETGAPNGFAKRCYSRMSEQGYRTLLDVGCGDGRDSRYFARKGFSVTSVDFSESGIERLNTLMTIDEKRKIDARRMDIRRLAFPDRSFDVIYAHLSLHYFDDGTTTRIFDALFRLLKKGGMIFIKCKSVDDPLYGVGARIGDDMYIKGHPRHFFSKEYMKEKLRSFDILTIRKTSSVYHRYKSAFIEAVARK